MWGRLEELEVGGGGGELEGEAEEAGDFEEDAFAGGAFYAVKVAFVAVHGALADNADAAPVHVGCDFGRAEVVGLRQLAHGCYKCVHVGGSHGHRLAVGRAFHVSILEGGRTVYDGVKCEPRGMHEKQIAYEGDILADLTACPHDYACVHGGEHVKSEVGKLSVCGKFCVCPFEVAHGKPLRGGHIF